MSRNPDIQRLLANLRSISSTPPAVGNGEPTNVYQAKDMTLAPGVNQSTSQNNGTTALGPSSVTDRYSTGSARISQHPSPGPNSAHVSPSKHLVSREPQPSSTPPPIPDASTITTWPAALKHVTKHIATNPKAAQKIKHLISEQHKHERQWWAARQEIVSRHTNRAGNQQKAAELLKSLGAIAKPATPLDPDAEKVELEIYDRKVYKGMTMMAADFDRQLRVLGIPFFATKHELVILQKGKETEGVDAGKLRLDKGELRELQKRMIQMLEDLFGDD